MESRPSYTSHLVAATLAVSVGLLGVPSLSRAAAPPTPTLVRMMVPDEDPASVRVELRIDTEGLGETAEPMAMKIAERGAEVFAARGVAEPSDPGDPIIVVVVERTGTEENPGFVVGFSLEQNDEIISGSVRQADCSLCTRGELLDMIADELPGLVELASEHQVAPAIGEEGGEEGGEGGEEGGDGDVAAIGPLGFAGIGLGVVGIAGVGVGAAFAARGVEPVEPTNEERTDYATPGLVVLSIGAAALIGGIVMIAVDVSKRKKARKGQAGAGARIEARGAGFAF